jgi:hypothetical protein
MPDWLSSLSPYVGYLSAFLGGSFVQGILKDWLRGRGRYKEDLVVRRVSAISELVRRFNEWNLGLNVIANGAYKTIRDPSFNPIDITKWVLANQVELGRRTVLEWERFDASLASFTNAALDEVKAHDPRLMHALDSWINGFTDRVSKAAKKDLRDMEFGVVAHKEWVGARKAGIKSCNEFVARAIASNDIIPS